MQKKPADPYFSFSMKADVAAAFDVAGAYVAELFGFRRQPEVFLDVVPGDVVAPHGAENEIAVLDDQVRAAFDEDAEPMRVIGDKGKEPMDQDDDQAPAERGEERGIAVDRAGEDGSKDDDKHGIESCLACERAFMTEADHDERRDKDNHAAQRDLKKS